MLPYQLHCVQPPPDPDELVLDVLLLDDEVLLVELVDVDELDEEELEPVSSRLKNRMTASSSTGRLWLTPCRLMASTGAFSPLPP